MKHQSNVDEHYPGCEFEEMMNYNGTSMNGKKCIGVPKFSPDVPQVDLAYKTCFVVHNPVRSRPYTVYF